MTREFTQCADAFGYLLDDFQWITVNSVKSAFTHSEKHAIISTVMNTWYAGLQRFLKTIGLQLVWMKISAKRITDLLAICLEVDASVIPSDATWENTEGWDSVTHLSLLGLIEDECPGILDQFPKIAGAQSILDMASICNSS